MATLPARQPRHLAQVLAVGILVTGCGGGGNGGTPPPTTAIAKASTNSGDAQAGTVGQPLTTALSVVVTEEGSPSAGETVAWSTTAANSSVNPTSDATDANGIASTGWTLGTVSGAQTATATLTGAAGSPVTFTATANADVATALSDAGGNNQTGETGTQLAAPVQAKVSDEFGNGVQDVIVEWAATGATVSALSVESNAAGISAVNVTLGGSAGTVTIVATSGTLLGSPLTFSATAETPAPAGPTIQVLTAGGNRFDPANVTITAPATVTWNWPSGSLDHNVVPDNGTTPATSGGLEDGPNTYSFTFDTPGTYRYYCANHGGPGGVLMSGTITVQ